MWFNINKSMEKLPEKYFMGVEFFRVVDPEHPDADGYWACLDAMRGLFDDPAFKQSTPGFYINHITNTDDDNRNSLRVVYHSVDPAKTQKAIEDFLTKNNDKVKLFNSKTSHKADPARSDEPKGEEYEFQSFLSTNTRIFLDVSKSYGQPRLQALVFSYRHFCITQRMSPETVFEIVFTKHSATFKELKAKSLDQQYWTDLTRYFNNNDFGLHFLVNMSAIQESALTIRRCFKKIGFCTIK